MTSFIIGRALLRSGVFPTVQIFATRPIFSNRRPTWVMQRDLVTTSTADSESDVEPKLDRKARASTNVAGKSKSKRNAKHSAKPKAKKKTKIEPKDLPPTPPGSVFMLWFSDWRRSQPKAEDLQASQKNAVTGGQIWRTLADHDKQQYRGKFNDLQTEYRQRLKEWRANVDPTIVRELNRRRAARGLPRMHSLGGSRPVSGFVRYVQQLWEENPRTEGNHQAHFKAMSELASSQWKAMSDAEKAKYNEPAKADFAAWHESRKAKSGKVVGELSQ